MSTEANGTQAAEFSPAVQNAVKRFHQRMNDHRRNADFRAGAQAMREMLARFVEGCDPVTAQSLRLNWAPSWGDDPGRPDAVAELPFIRRAPSSRADFCPKCKVQFGEFDGSDPLPEVCPNCQTTLIKGSELYAIRPTPPAPAAGRSVYDAITEAERLLSETFDKLDPDDEADAWVMVRITKVREALADVMPESLRAEVARLRAASETPFGYCPICGAPGTSRECRPNSNDRCANGHEYPSVKATAAPIAASGGQEQQYVPWTFETMPVAVKVRSKDEGRPGMAMPFGGDLAFVMGRHHPTYQRLFDEFTQLDGTPCGTLKE